MQKKYKSKEFINSLILNTMEFTILYKKHKSVLLIPGVLEQCIDVVTVHRQLKELRNLGLINNFYKRSGFINECMKVNNMMAFRHIDITPRKLRKIINNFKKVVEKYENKR